MIDRKEKFKSKDDGVVFCSKRRKRGVYLSRKISVHKVQEYKKKKQRNVVFEQSVNTNKL